MLEFKSSVLKFSFNGQDCAVKFPTIKALKEFREKNKGDDEESIDSTIDFLVSLGLKLEVAESLEINHLKVIIESISGEAKKN